MTDKGIQLDRKSNSVEDSSQNNSQVGKKKKKTPVNLEGFALVEYKCRKKKGRYDRCYAQKHSAFVSAKEFQDKNGEDISCDDLFDSYRECILLGMKRLREERGLPNPNPESALGEFEEEIAED